MAWERPDVSLARRLGGTLLGALSPVRESVAFAFGESRRAFVFFVLTFVPLALLRGVIPYTKLLHFGPLFAVTVSDGATPPRVALDVARAAGISFAEILVVFVALLVCYRSLASAFGRETSAAVATRALLYRGFLLPLGALLPVPLASGDEIVADGLLLSIGLWSMPARLDFVALALLLVWLVPSVPVVLTFVSMRSVARLVMGAEPVASFLIALVPFVLSVVVFGLLHSALSPLIPPIVLQ